jgi:hypothetical protein
MMILMLSQSNTWDSDGRKGVDSCTDSLVSRLTVDSIGLLRVNWVWRLLFLAQAPLIAFPRTPSDSRRENRSSLCRKSRFWVIRT